MEKKKIILIIVSIVALLISVLVMFKVFNKNEKRTYNIPNGATLVENTDTLKEQKVENLLVSDVLVYTVNGISKYTATISNTSKKDLTATLYLTFYEGEDKIEIVAFQNKEIKANSKTNVDITFEIDLTKTTKIEYKLK